MKRKLLGTACALVLAMPSAGAAQIAWDSPMLLPPNPTGEFGVYLMDAAGGGVGVLGTWRSPVWNFGLRGGLAESAGGGVGLFGGVDYNGMINRASPEFPLDIDWVFGAGLGIGDGVRISVPLGLTAGHHFDADGASFTPYITPRVVLDGFIDSESEQDNLGLDFAVDLGLDMRLAGTSGLTFRFAGTFGDRDALALGVVF